MSRLSYKLKRLSQKGFSHVETFLVMVVIIAIAGVGAYVIKHNESHAGSGCNTQVFANGSTGTCVKDVQTLVNFYNSAKNSKYTALAVDGDFGPLTKAAVQTFQKDSNLATDGIVGQDTWKAICTPVTPPKTTTTAYKAALLDACNGTTKTSTATKTTTGSGSGSGSSSGSSTAMAASSTTTTSTTKSTSGSSQVTTTTTTYTNFATVVTPVSTLGYNDINITQKGARGYTTKEYVNNKYKSTKTVQPINQLEQEGYSVVLENGNKYPNGIQIVSLGNTSNEINETSTLYLEASSWFRGSLYPTLAAGPVSGYNGDFIMTACYNSSKRTVYFHALNTKGKNYDAHGADVTLTAYYHTSGGAIVASDYSSTWNYNVTGVSLGVDTAAVDNPSTSTVWATVGIPTENGTGSAGVNINTKAVDLSTLPSCLPTAFGTPKYSN